jgi:basic membrane protein A
MLQRTRRMRGLIGLVLVLAVLATACGDDDDSTASGSATTAKGGQSPATTAARGDKGAIGYVVAGDRNDGGFYQGQVEAVQKAAKEAGYKVTIVDKVNPGAAQEAFQNLARQGPDLIIAGGSELRDGFVPVSESPEFKDTTFVLVAGFPPDKDTYATVGGNENEAHFLGGVAAGLLLKRAGKHTACVTAGPELDFVKNMAKAMTAGLHSLSPDDKMLVTYTGDFEDASLAQEAATAQISQGCQVIYPYLGGALMAVVKAGNAAKIDVVATSIDGCGAPGNMFQMSILYNPALYLDDVIAAFTKGEIQPGKQFKLYGVKDNVGIGANICNATPEEQKTLDDTAKKIASGEIDVNKLLGTSVSG